MKEFSILRWKSERSFAWEEEMLSETKRDTVKKQSCISTILNI